MKTNPSFPQNESDTASSWLALLVLLITAALELVWSNSKMMWNDEFLAFYTDRVPSLRSVLSIQLHHPISLDPPAFHLLSHLSMSVVGNNALGLRLPAMLGFLLLQMALFLLLRPLAGARAALLAMVLPLLTATFPYAVEGRPYALLLGLTATAILCWYTACRELALLRLCALAGMVACMVLAINAHFFGLLILIPVCSAELARIGLRRRFDLSMLAALGISVASVALILPFKKAVDPFRVHYYSTHITPRMIANSYRAMLPLADHSWPRSFQTGIALALMLALGAMLWDLYPRFRQGDAAKSGLWIALLTLSMLPFFGFVVGRFVTHGMEARHVIAGAVAIPILIVLVAAPRLTRQAARVSFVILLLLAITWNVRCIRSSQRETRQTLASLTASSALQQKLDQQPEQRLYVQDMRSFFRDVYYTPDASLRARITHVYDDQRDLEWLGHDTYAITAENLKSFSGLPVLSFDAMRKEHNPIVITAPLPEDWMLRELEATQVPMQPLGVALDGQAIQITGTP